MCPPYLQVSGWSDQNWMSYADDKVKYRLFFFLTLKLPITTIVICLSSACDFQSLFCKQCGPRSDEEQSDQGPHCLPVCKNRFEKFARIFSRRHKQTTFSDAGFLGILRVNNQGDIIMIRPGQVSNSSEIQSMSISSANFRKIQSKLKELYWWQSQTNAFFSNPWLMIQSGQVSNSSYM